MCGYSNCTKSIGKESAAISVMAERIEVQDDTDKKFEKGI